MAEIPKADLTKLVGENVGVKKGVQYLSIAVTILGMMTVGVGAYYVYKNNFWEPKIKIDDIDFDKGTAKFTVTNIKIKPHKELSGDSTLSVGGDWGIRLSKNGLGKYDRLEKVRGNLVHGTIYAPKK